MAKLSLAQARIDAFIERWMMLHNVPGLTMSITDRNETLCVINRGFADVERREPIGPGALFEAGSIGKSFTALCLVQLAEAGVLDLNRPAVPSTELLVSVDAVDAIWNTPAKRTAAISSGVLQFTAGQTVQKRYCSLLP